MARRRKPAPSHARPGPRMVGQRRDMPKLVRIGRQREWRDVYHRMLTLTWPGFFFVMGGGYIGINVLFALLYMIDPDGIAEARPGSFADAFFFSVQTVATIGYGVMHPQTLYANLVMTGETLYGLIFFAVLTGLIFARFSRPTARVLFSEVAVITPHDGVPTLMFRCANQRTNQIVQAAIAVTALRDELSAEGRQMRRFHDLKLLRQRTPVFALTWTVMHPIDADSPLHGMTPRDLEREDIEIVVVLTGTDETFAQTIQARHSYLGDEIRWHHCFVDVLSEGEDGTVTIDYSRFHEVRPDGTAAPAKARVDRSESFIATKRSNDG